MMDTEKQMEVIAGLEYIANSPSREHGGFHGNAVDTAEDALSLIEEQRRRIAELEAEQPAKPFDFDALFADTRRTVEYWQTKCELLEGEIRVLEDDIAAMDDELVVMNNEITELEAERRWIPVDERLPERGSNVLCTWHGKYHHICYMDTSTNIADWWDGATDEPLSQKPTHWQPLPEPPEVTT